MAASRGCKRSLRLGERKRERRGRLCRRRAACCHDGIARRQTLALQACEERPAGGEALEDILAFLLD